MNESPTVAVEATDEKYFVLKHQPTGLGLDADGKGTWPADQFTFRLAAEKSIRIVKDKAPAAAAGPHSANVSHQSVARSERARNRS
jgi:hypothetical protein